MSKLIFLSCIVLGLVITLLARTRQEDKSDGISKRVAILRQVNTEEYNYRERYARFGNREQLLAYMRESGATKAVDRLEHLESFQLSVITSSDGGHYQVSLTPLLDDGNRAGWCDKAGFADDRGVIFLGAALNCEGAAKY